MGDAARRFVSRLVGFAVAVAVIVLVGVPVVSVVEAREVLRSEFASSIEAIDLLRPDASDVLRADAEGVLRVPAPRGGGDDVALRTGRANSLWRAFSLAADERDADADSAPRVAVLQGDPGGVAGSGVPRPRLPSRAVGRVLLLADDRSALREATRRDDGGVVIPLPRRGVLDVVVELFDPPPRVLRLRRPDALGDADRAAKLRGLMIGLALAALVGALALSLVAPSASLLAVVALSSAAVLMLVSRFGVVEPLVDPSPLLAALHLNPERLAARVHALGEACALLAVALLAVAPLAARLRKRNVALALPALCAPAPLLALVAPEDAAAIARFAAPPVAAIGALLAVRRLRDEEGARADVPLQFAVLAWSAVPLAVAAFAAPGSLIDLAVYYVLAPLCPLALAAAAAAVLAERRGGAGAFFESSARRLRALAGGGAAVWEWTPDDDKLRVGYRLERDLNLAPGELARHGATRWLNAVHPLDRAELADAMRRAAKRRQNLNAEFRIRDDDRGWKRKLLRAKPVDVRDGIADAVVGLVFDAPEPPTSHQRLIADAEKIAELRNLIRRDRESESDLACVALLHLVRDPDADDQSDHDDSDHDARSASLLAARRRVAQALGDPKRVVRDGARRLLVALKLHDDAKSPDDVARRLAMLRDAAVASSPLSCRVAAAVERPPTNDPRRDEHFNSDVASDVALASLLERAHRALQRALADPREPIVADLGDSDSASDSDSAPDSASDSAPSLAEELARALDQGDIDVAWRPIAAAEGGFRGCLAMPRWRRRDGDLVADALIRVADESRLAQPVARRLLEEATRILGVWQRSYQPDPPLFAVVALGEGVPLDDDDVTRAAQRLEREKPAQGALVLRCDEEAIVADPEAFRRAEKRLRALGARTAWGRFGGHPEGRMLNPLAIARLNRVALIDLSSEALAAAVRLRALAAEGRERPDAELPDRLAAEGFLALARSADAPLAALELKTSEEIDAARALGCLYLAGPVFGRDLSTDEMTDALAAASLSPEGSEAPDDDESASAPRRWSVFAPQSDADADSDDDDDAERREPILDRGFAREMEIESSDDDEAIRRSDSASRVAELVRRLRGGERRERGDAE